MFAVLLSFTYVICDLFIILKIWIEEPDYTAIAVYSIAWLSNHCLLIFSMIYMGESSRNEVWLFIQMPGFSHFIDPFSQGIKTATYLHKISNYEENLQFTKPILMFSQQLMHRKPKFTCGLFVFDYSFAFRVRNSFKNEQIYVNQLIYFRW